MFEHEFVVGAELRIATGTPAGDLVVPASLRYQACNDRVCFRPVTATTSWTVRVVGANFRKYRREWYAEGQARRSRVAKIGRRMQQSAAQDETDR